MENTFRNIFPRPHIGSNHAVRWPLGTLTCIRVTQAREYKRTSPALAASALTFQSQSLIDMTARQDAYRRKGTPE